MGYPRFGAMWALILVRLCIGTPFSWDSPELLLMLLVFLSEVVEDGTFRKTGAVVEPQWI